MKASKFDASCSPLLHVAFGTAGADRKELRFTKPFRIGRTDECEVCIKDHHVSRNHAEAFFEGGRWWIRDLNSTNGMYIDGQRFERLAVSGTLTIRLGVLGPEVSLRAEPPSAEMGDHEDDEAVIAHLVEHYFGESAASGPVGKHTMFVRKAFAQVQRKRKRTYRYVVAALLLGVLAAGIYGLYEHQQIKMQKAMAGDLFYAMKAIDVDIANVERTALRSNDQQSLEVIRRDEDRRKEMQREYDQFLATLHVYNPKLTDQQKLVMRVARIFGECELDMPPDFMSEVNRYIKLWQSSGKLAQGIAAAKSRGYVSTISSDFLAQGLPPQYFYLALQESGFDPYASGPMTRKGVAKGMWQFVPETALKYGLHLGPLVDLRRPDPGDDRHHWEKETKAAVSYIKDLYSTDAQASGLLVMACYNWGEDQVLPLVRSMPANPRERNFWQLLAKHRDKIPQQTYDYVFYIISAAVIGENPRLFGFDFDNPLADAGNNKSSGLSTGDLLAGSSGTTKAADPVWSAMPFLTAEPDVPMGI
jgi:hypothetical protein